MKSVLACIVICGLVQGSALAAQEPVVAALSEDRLESVERSAEGSDATVDETVLYEREVFQYSAASRPDPFRSLLLEGVGVRLEDLSLRGILYDPIAAGSVAVLSQAGSDRRIQLRVGERIGSVRILSIEADRVEIVREELGVSRRETLRLARPQTGATP